MPQLIAVIIALYIISSIFYTSWTFVIDLKRGFIKTIEMRIYNNEKKVEPYQILFHSSTEHSHWILPDGHLKIYLDKDSLHKAHLDTLKKIVKDTAHQGQLLDWGKKLIQGSMLKHQIVASKKSNLEASSRIQQYFSQINISQALAAHAVWQRLHAKEWVHKVGIAHISSKIDSLIPEKDKLAKLYEWASVRNQRKEFIRRLADTTLILRPIPPEIPLILDWVIYEEYCPDTISFQLRKREMEYYWGGKEKLFHSVWGKFIDFGKVCYDERVSKGDSILPPKNERAFAIAAIDRLAGIDPTVSEEARRIYQKLFYDTKLSFSGNAIEKLKYEYSFKDGNKYWENSFFLDEHFNPPFLYFHDEGKFFLRSACTFSPPSFIPYALIDERISLNNGRLDDRGGKYQGLFGAIAWLIDLLTIPPGIVLILLSCYFISWTISIFVFEAFPRVRENPYFIRFRNETVLYTLLFWKSFKKSPLLYRSTILLYGVSIPLAWWNIEPEFILFNQSYSWIKFLFATLFATFFINLITQTIQNFITGCLFLTRYNPEEGVLDEILGFIFSLSFFLLMGFNVAEFISGFLIGFFNPILVRKIENYQKNGNLKEDFKKMKTILFKPKNIVESANNN